MPISIICEICKKQFLVPPKRMRGRVARFCSRDCRYKRTDQKIFDFSCKICGDPYKSRRSEGFCSKKCWGVGNRDESNYLWKGDLASYRTKHHWVVTRLGKANHCTKCGLDRIPDDKKRYFDWANISGEYKREITVWVQLCKACHGAFDKGRRRRRRHIIA